MESIWQKSVKLPAFLHLQGDLRTDVAIIGGGITGILTAYFLQKSGVDCILLEKGTICQGTTSGTTAKITYQHGLCYHSLLKKEGKDVAQCYWNANVLALKQYEALCADVDCDFERKDQYVYTIDDRKVLEEEAAALTALGCDYTLCPTPTLPFSTAGAIRIPHQAQFHPLKWIAAIAKDLPIYEHTFVNAVQGNTVLTEYGKITANAVIIATHFPFINRHGSYFLKLYQHRSYVLALKNAQNVEGMFVDHSPLGLSFRNYQDLLLLGGGSHRTGKQGGNWSELRHDAKLYYPESTECCHWAVQDCMSLDGRPYIGKYSSATQQLYTATGFHKWGMTGSMVAAQLLCDLVQGKENPYASVFSPSRSMLKPQLFLNGIESVINLLRFTTRRCPHLGCALQWNRAEHSWDCPCHGSRLDENGGVLDNPANRK